MVPLSALHFPEAGLPNTCHPFKLDPSDKEVHPVSAEGACTVESVVAVVSAVVVLVDEELHAAKSIAAVAIVANCFTCLFVFE